jgi:tetratricopeptide (TPR) repeat protein
VRRTAGDFVASASLLVPRTFRSGLLVFGALALGVRILNVWYVVSALSTAQIWDAAYYHDVALALMSGRVLPGPPDNTAFANLGYPYVLLGLYGVGASPTGVLVVQAFLGGVTTLLVGILGRDAFGERRVGLTAAALFALYAPAIFYDGLLLVPSLSAFLAAVLGCSLWRAVHLGCWRWCVLAGLAMGAAALLRASQLLLLPFALAAIARLHVGPARARGRLLSALCLSAAVCVAPIVVRERLESGHWIPVTANSGMNFWIGNHPGAPGRYTNAPFLGSSKGGDYQHAVIVERDRFRAEAQRRSGKTELSLAEADRFWWRQTARAIVEAPAPWLRALARKSWLVTNDYELRTNTSLDFLQQISPVLRWNPLRFGILEILAALGAAELVRARGRLKASSASWVLGPLVAVPVLTCLVFFVSGEYRHAAAPALAAFAAFGLVRLVSLVATWPAESWFAAWPCGLVPLMSLLAFTSVERLGPAQDRKAYAEALAMRSAAGNLPTRERYALARKLLSEHGASRDDRLLSAEAMLLVESNQAIQFRDVDAARRLISATQSLWQEDLQAGGGIDSGTIERMRKNSVRRVAQLCRQPFVQTWAAVQLDLTLLGCRSWQELGALLGRGLFAQAEPLLARALILAPRSVEVLAYRGQLELLRGRDPTSWLERSLKEYPRLALPARLMSQYQRAQGDLSRAQRYAEEALRREPDNLAARDLVSSGDDSTSRPAPSPESAEIVASRVRVLLQEGRSEKAISLLQAAVRNGAYDEELHYTLGNLMLSHSPPQALLRFFSSEVEHDQKPQTSHYFMALALERQGQDDAALGELRQALEIDPAHEMSQRQWGLVLERQGHLEAALAHFVEATRVHPEYRSALEDVARVLARLGRKFEAEQWQKRALSANPATPRRFLYWSRYLHEHGRDSAALAELARWPSEAPRDEEALALERSIRRTLAKRPPPP